MPDETAEGPPSGREDPNAGKIMGFPWWVWALAAGGTFALVWFLHRQGSSASTDLTGSASNTPSDTGVMNTDLSSQPTLADVLAAMQALAKSNGATQQSPAPTPSSSGLLKRIGPGSLPWVNITTNPPVSGGLTSSHTWGNGPDLRKVSQPPAGLFKKATADLNPGPGTPAGYSTSSVAVSKVKKILTPGHLPVTEVVTSKLQVPAQNNYNPVHARSSGNQAIT